MAPTYWDHGIRPRAEREREQDDDEYATILLTCEMFS